MPIRTVASNRLYRQIAEQLSSLIANGEYPEGGRLPSERELSTQLGVSRPTVREALIALEVARKVEVRVGSGVFVARRQPTPLPDEVGEGEGPFELLRARFVVEGQIAYEAARAAAPADLAVIRAAVAEMQKNERQKRDADAADRAFHLGIANATHNGVLVAIVRDLWDRGRGAIWKRMEHHFQTPDLRAATLRDHRAILAALEARDPGAARSATRAHLKRVDKEFSLGWKVLKARESEKQEQETAAARQRAAKRSARK